MNYQIVLKNRYNTKYPMISVYHIFEHMIILEIKKILHANDIYIFEIYANTNNHYTNIIIETQIPIYLILELFINKLQDGVIDFSTSFKLSINEIKEEMRFIFLSNNLANDLYVKTINSLPKDDNICYKFSGLYKKIELFKSESNVFTSLLREKVFQHDRIIELNLTKIREEVLVKNKFNTKENFSISTLDINKYAYILVYCSFELVDINKEIKEIYKLKSDIEFYMEGRVIDSKITFISDEMYELFFVLDIAFLDTFQCYVKKNMDDKIKINYRGIL